MNIRLLSKVEKLKLVVIPLAVGLVTVGIVVASNNPESTGADEKPPIVAQVEHHQEVLDNHEDRITNSEKDISTLQGNTNTPPSSDRVVVREVVTEKPSQPLTLPSSPTPEPTPVPTPLPHPRTIVSVDLSLYGTPEGTMISCRYKLHDGTLHNTEHELNVTCLKVRDILP